MKFIHFSILILFFFIGPGLTKGQNLKENELVVIQGEKFILHQVRTGETIYSISRDFKIESSQLRKYNPAISEGLSIGDILKIPFNEKVDLSQIPGYKKGDPTGFVNYTIDTKGETAYSISKKYGVTVEEIYAYNPSVKKLKKGMTLKIPQWNKDTQTETKNIEKATADQNVQQTSMIEHFVVSGETLYSIGKKYKVTESEILNFNPEAKSLKTGMKLRLPDKSGMNEANIQLITGKNQDNFIEHQIVSGETLYGISQKYHVNTDELISLNPELKTGFRTGVVIKIPVPDNTSTVQNQVDQKTENIDLQNTEAVVSVPLNRPSGCYPGSGSSFNGTVNVALFLPLFLDSNEQLNESLVEKSADSLRLVEIIGETLADSIIEEEKPKQLLRQFYGNSENFLQFYEGVLIAVDSMQKAGMQIKLNVYDTKDNPQAIRKIVNDEAFLTNNLIIGPVYENVQNEISGIAQKHQIPMISPFIAKSDIINRNTEYYQINPSREYLSDATVEMIAQDYSKTNFIVLKTSPYEGKPEGQMVNMIRHTLEKIQNYGEGSFTEYDFRKERSAGLSNVLKPDRENVIFIPSSDEGELSVAISNINNFAAEYSITLIGTSNYQQRFPSIEVSHYHNLKFKYLNPYWIEYQDIATIKYFEKFITDFGTEPNSFGVQGFDVAFYFLNALHFYGQNFKDCLPFMKIKLVQGNYYFKKVSPSGGYMNEGVSEISYTKDFEVKREKVVGGQFVDGE